MVCFPQQDFCKSEVLEALGVSYFSQNLPSGGKLCFMPDPLLTPQSSIAGLCSPVLMALGGMICFSQQDLCLSETLEALGVSYFSRNLSSGGKLCFMPDLSLRSSAHPAILHCGLVRLGPVQPCKVALEAWSAFLNKTFARVRFWRLWV